MSTQTTPEPHFSRESLQVLNNLCDEFRRQVKQSALDSGHSDPVMRVGDLLASAQSICDSDWLVNFRETLHDERTRQAA